MYTVFMNKTNKIYSEYVFIISYWWHIMEGWRPVRQVFENGDNNEDGRAAPRNLGHSDPRGDAY